MPERDNSEKSRSEYDIAKERALRGDIILASSRGKQALQRKIKETEEEIARAKLRLGEAAKRDPDLPENTEFKELKTYIQTQLTRRFNELLDTESKLRIHSDPREDIIGFGNVFEASIKYPNEDEPECGKYILLGPIEATYVDLSDIRLTVVSYLSPFGKAVWGAKYKNGNQVEFSTPGGVTKCTITTYE